MVLLNSALSPHTKNKNLSSKFWAKAHKDRYFAALLFWKACRRRRKLSNTKVTISCCICSKKLLNNMLAKDLHNLTYLDAFFPTYPKTSSGQKIRQGLPCFITYPSFLFQLSNISINPRKSCFSLKKTRILLKIILTQTFVKPHFIELSI